VPAIVRSVVLRPSGSGECASASGECTPAQSSGFAQETRIRHERIGRAHAPLGCDGRFRNRSRQCSSTHRAPSHPRGIPKEGTLTRGSRHDRPLPSTVAFGPEAAWATRGASKTPATNERSKDRRSRRVPPTRVECCVRSSPSGESTSPSRAPTCSRDFAQFSRSTLSKRKIFTETRLAATAHRTTASRCEILLDMSLESSKLLNIESESR